MLLKIEEELQPTKQSLLTIAQKNRRAPLRSAQSARFSARGIGELSQAGNQLDRPRVIEGRERLNQRAIKTKGRRHRAQGAAAGIEVCAKIGKQVLGRTITDVDVHRREPARHSSITESGKSVDRIKLVPSSRYQRAVKVRIEEILATNRDA